LQQGIALHRAGDLDAAAAVYREILAAAPGHADALHLLGLVAYRRGELDTGRQMIEQALAADPDNPVFLANLGNVRKDLQDRAGAIECYQRALAIDPRQHGARNNLGTLLMADGDLDAALACFDQVIAVSPQHARAWLNLGSVHALRGELGRAAQALAQAVALQPDLAVAWGELGLAYLALGRHADAVDALRRRAALMPADAVGHADLALALHRAGDRVAACHAYERALELDPLALEIRCNLCALLQSCCDWERLAVHWPHVLAAIERGEPGVPLGLLVSQPDVGARHQLAAARANAARWLSESAAAAAPAGAMADVSWVPGVAPVRVGYLSADFREHATAYLIAEVLELHDRARVEVLLFSYGPDDGSAMRARLVRAADRFVDLRGSDDDEAARSIRAAGIDVLVDLNGNTDNGRMGIAARRPAPVQVNWLGFPGTLGAPFYDYLVADRHVIPTGAERWYSEQVIRLPDCYQCNDRQRVRPVDAPGRTALGLPEDAVVLCCFNQAFKITQPVFDAWLRILAQVPRAVLWLLDDNDIAGASLRARAAAAGIASERLVFGPRQSLAGHLARYLVADLALDTFPCTSHTTASDALWMGCPLVTVTGETFAGRVATTQQRNDDAAALAVADMPSYERLALALATDASQRRAWRVQLESARTRAPLFDTPRFTAALESTWIALARKGPSALT
jgi:predicted O-linked N-acetylglucosamine transferase (SPINDLY family)